MSALLEPFGFSCDFIDSGTATNGLAVVLALVSLSLMALFAAVKQLSLRLVLPLFCCADIGVGTTTKELALVLVLISLRLLALCA